MENYPSNSQSAKAQNDRPPLKSLPRPEKNVKKVTVGPVVQRKKPLGRRIVETFGGVNLQDVVGYIFTDVLIPAAKDMIVDAGSQALERTFYGDSRGRTRTSNNSRPSSSTYTSYNRYSAQTNRRPDPRQQISPHGRAVHNFDEIILESRAEAQEVVDQIFTLIRDYEQATVSDLYEMVGITGEFTDEKWGWTDVRGMSIIRIKGGYLLDLPPTEYLGDDR